MALPNQMSAFDDCYALWEQALNDPKGARALMPSYEEAGMLRMRMNHSRVLQRDLTRRMYSEADPRWNTSEYDKLTVKVKPAAEGETGYWVYIERHGSNILAIEPLSEGENATGSAA